MNVALKEKLRTEAAHEDCCARMVAFDEGLTFLEIVRCSCKATSRKEACSAELVRVTRARWEFLKTFKYPHKYLRKELRKLLQNMDNHDRSFQIEILRKINARARRAQESQERRKHGHRHE